MKKVLSLLALGVFVFAISFAGTVATPTKESGSVVLREGRNTVRLRNGATLLFMFRGGEISGAEVRKSTGRVVKFEDTDCATCGTEPPKPCTGETRCHYSEKYKATICFCMPKLNLSSGGSGGVGAQADYYLKMDTIEGESD